MGTQLILTVGKNPLPVWVAWDCLTNHWRDKNENHKIGVQFVYTEGTEEEKELLKGYCQGPGVRVLDDIPTSQHTPNQLDICRRIVRAYRPEFTNLHVHYTGGTQAMGVATVCAMVLAKGELSEQQLGVSLDASYLDPGRGSTPMIVSWNNPTPPQILTDTRVGISASIQKIAKINGFQAGDFHSQDPPGYCGAPKKPSPEQLLAGQTVLDHIGEFDDLHYNSRLKKWFINNTFRDLWETQFHRGSDFYHPECDGTFALPEADDCTWQQDLLKTLNKMYPIPQWDIEKKELNYPAYHSATSDEKKGLKEVDAFFSGIWLEYAAYAAFEKVLNEIKDKKPCRRGNFQLRHNVYVRRKDRNSPRIAERHFELDVVAVLGYQVVVVSCSTTSRISTVKQKAMEAYHRARQLGGVEARAVVLSLASYEDAERVEKELEDETGAARPLQVWGREKGEPYRGRGQNRPDKPGKIPNMDSLCEKFRELLYKGYENGEPWHLHWE